MTILRSLGYLILAHIIYGSALAQITDEVHEKCKEARDYAGCVKAYAVVPQIKKEFAPDKELPKEGLGATSDAQSTKGEQAAFNLSADSSIVESSDWLGPQNILEETVRSDSVVLLENDNDGALIYRPSEGVVFLTSFQLFRPMKLMLQLPNQEQQLFFGVFDRGNRTGSSLSRATFSSLDQVKFNVIEGSELEHSLLMRVRSETINEGILRALESGDTFSIALREREDGPWIVGSYKPRPMEEESYRRLAENSPESFCGSTQVFNHIDKNNPVALLKMKGEPEDVLIQDVISDLAIDCDQVLTGVRAKEENQNSLLSPPDGHVFVWLRDGFTRDGFKKMMSMRPKAVKYCLVCAGDQCRMKQWPEEREDEFNLCKRLFATPKKPRPGLLEDNSSDITTKSFFAAFDFKISKKGRGELLRIRHLEGEYSMKEATKVISRALYRVKYEPLVLEGKTVEIANLSSAVGQRNSLKML